MVLAKDISIGKYVKYNNVIYQLKRKEVVVCGTHSHSKLKLFLKPFEGGGEKAINFSHTDNLETLDILRKKGQVLSVNGKKAQIMDLESYETFDAVLHESLTEEPKEGEEAFFVQIEGKVFIIGKK